MSQIKIHIDAEGQITVDTAGYKGASCREATRAIEEALGTVNNETMKPEYYMSAHADSQVKVNGGN